MFYHHMINLPTDSLAFEITETQEKLSYPGLVKECNTLIEKYDLPDLKIMTRLQWKRAVTKKTLETNKTDLLEKIRKYKKIDFQTLSSENLKPKII